MKPIYCSYPPGGRSVRFFFLIKRWFAGWRFIGAARSQDFSSLNQDFVVSQYRQEIEEYGGIRNVKIIRRILPAAEWDDRVVEILGHVRHRK